jgi:MFS family permease
VERWPAGGKTTNPCGIRFNPPVLPLAPLDVTIDETAQPRSAPASAAPSEPLLPLLALITAVQMLATYAVFALPTIAPKAAVTLGVAPPWIGYQMSVIYLAAASVSSYAGVIVRRYGACSTSLVAMALCAVGVCGLASGNLIITGLASVIVGFGYGLTNPSASHLLLRYAPAGRRNLIFAIKQAGVPLGGIIAAAMLPGLSLRLGWQNAVLASSLLIVALMLPLWRRCERWDSDRAPATRFQDGGLKGLNVIFADRELRSLAVTGFCFAGFQVCLVAFAMTLLVTELGWSLVNAGLVLTAVQAAGVIGRLSWSVLADRIGHGLRLLAGIGALIASLGLLTSTMTAAWSASATVAVLFAFGGCLIGWNGLYMAEVARVSGPAKVGIATGGIMMFNFTGVIIAPATFGLISKWLGSTAATFGWFSLLPLVGALALIPALRHQRAAH